MGNMVPVLDQQVLSTSKAILGTEENILTVEKALQTKEYILDCAMWAVTHGIIEQIAGSTIGWVNTGLGGNPYYITDPDIFFAGLEDQVTAKYFSNRLRSASIPSSYKSSVINSLAQSRRRISVEDALECPVGNKSQTLFTERDADEGWDNFLQVTTDPACTPYGSYQIAETELLREIESVKEETIFNATEEAFLPDTEQGEVVTPGVVIKEQLNDVLESGVTQLENADELQEAIGALGDLVYGILGDSLSLRSVDSSIFTGSTAMGNDNFIPTPRTFRSTSTATSTPGGLPPAAARTLSNTVSDMQRIIASDETNVKTDGQIRDWFADIMDYLDDLEYSISVNDKVGMLAAIGVREQSPFGWLWNYSQTGTGIIGRLDRIEDKYRTYPIGAADKAALETLIKEALISLADINTSYSLGIRSTSLQTTGTITINNYGTYPPPSPNAQQQTVTAPFIINDSQYPADPTRW